MTSPHRSISWPSLKISIPLRTYKLRPGLKNASPSRSYNVGPRAEVSIILINNIRKLTHDHLRSSLHDAVRFAESASFLMQPLQELNVLLSGIGDSSTRQANLQAMIDRKGVAEGRQDARPWIPPSVAAAKVVRDVMREGAHIETALLSAQALRPLYENTAAVAIDEGEKHVALTAVNDIYCAFMHVRQIVDVLNNNLTRISTQGKHPVKVELESLGFPQEVEKWMKVVEDWIASSSQPVWVTEQAKVMEDGDTTKTSEE